MIQNQHTTRQPQQVCSNIPSLVAPRNSNVGRVRTSIQRGAPISGRPGSNLLPNVGSSLTIPRTRSRDEQQVEDSLMVNHPSDLNDGGDYLTIERQSLLPTHLSEQRYNVADHSRPNASRYDSICCTEQPQPHERRDSFMSARSCSSVTHTSQLIEDDDATVRDIEEPQASYPSHEPEYWDSQR